ncbi:unnamed protein product [Zymoseptoria tritici ST99CH_3D1]|nr:unnamed protein product [Zymoseptoria tritici ST99CH_3D1]
MPPPFDFSPPSHAHFLRMGSNVDSRVEAVEATSSEEPYFAQSPFGYQVNIPCTKLKDAFCSRKPVSNMSRMVTDVPRSASQVADADESDKASKAELERQLQAAQDAQQTAVQQRTKDAEELQNRFEERIARFKQQAKDQDKKRREDITNVSNNLTRANTELSTANNELERQLKAAHDARQDAVRQATENAEKKARVQVNMRDVLQAKINAIKKAVQETPNKSIKEVWQVANQARAVARPAQPTSATPAAINGLAPDAPSSPDLRTATANSLATKAITNPILQRMKVNVFVTTPHDWDGTTNTAKTVNETLYLAAARNLEAFPSFPGVPMKHRVKIWPAGSMDHNATTERLSVINETPSPTAIYSVETPYPNELEGAKMLASAAVWRYVMPTRQHMEIIINVTHNAPNIAYPHATLQSALFKHVNEVQTRMLDWVEVRMFRFVEQTGGYELWKSTTKDQRLEAYNTVLKQFPVSIFTGLFSAEIVAHLDLGSMWGNSEDIDRARQEHCSFIFRWLCEAVWILVLEPLGESQPEFDKVIMRAKSRKMFRTCVYDSPIIVARNSRLGDLGDIPFLGFHGGTEDEDVVALMIARVAGVETKVSKL